MAKRKGTRSQSKNSPSLGQKHYDADEQDMGSRFARVTVPPQLEDPEARKRWRLPESEHDRGPYICELNLQHIGGLPGAANGFIELYKDVLQKMLAGKRGGKKEWEPGDVEPLRIAKTYYRCHLSVEEWRELVACDESRADAEAAKSEGRPQSYRVIYRIWPDFPVKAHMDRSLATVKADAALRSFAAAGEGITWAVIDSGIDAEHPHFGSEGSEHALRSDSVADLHRCFSSIFKIDGTVRIEQPLLADPDLNPAMDPVARQNLVEQHRTHALRDEFGHGTHVAGIVAGRAPSGAHQVIALEREDRIGENGQKSARRFAVRPVADATRLRGVAPDCKLVSIRVLDDRGNGRSSDVIRALEYIRERVNDNPKLMRVHGVNLSVGYEFDAEMFACGQSPLCAEVDRLVQAGLIVVAAAGNTGFGTIAADVRAAKVGMSNTINDPGNAALAITVGSTHRDAPHTYGVSYFSSKGPTGDGRLKPDLIAPGERITSCAAGHRLEEAMKQAQAGLEDVVKKAEARQNRDVAYYVDDSGTSMAAPHVSGAIAAFLSIRREFIGKPLEVKRIFLDSASPLGRERYFEGHGLLDLMRAIQSV